jgi:CheY-like chemotaxis protein
MPAVLVVDDDLNQRLLYQQYLEEAGYEVLLAASGPEALSVASSQKVDVVVLDIAMPGMDGVEALQRLLDMDRQLPVILNTAYANFRHDFMTWAAEAYIVKSSDLSELLERVAQACRKRGVAPPAGPTPEEESSG